MLIVDMQVGLLTGDPKHDLPGVIDRINRLAANARAVRHRHLHSALWRYRRRVRAAIARLGVATRTHSRSR
jgi:nicotinamidase-related amidase